MPEKRSSRIARRLERQFRALGRFAPQVEAPLRIIRARNWLVVRVPIALLFIVGGLMSVLPFLGLWMLPVGLLLLAVDVPFLRAPISGAIIRLRRRIQVWRRWFTRS